MISGKPVVLVDHGRFIAPNLNIERVTPEEILAEMRKVGLRALDQIEWAILEDDGRIAIIPRRPGDHPTAHRAEHNTPT